MIAAILCIAGVSMLQADGFQKETLPFCAPELHTGCTQYRDEAKDTVCTVYPDFFVWAYRHEVSSDKPVTSDFAVQKRKGNKDEISICEKGPSKSARRYKGMFYGMADRFLLSMIYTPSKTTVNAIDPATGKTVHTVDFYGWASVKGSVLSVWFPKSSMEKPDCKTDDYKGVTLIEQKIDLKTGDKSVDPSNTKCLDPLADKHMPCPY